MRTPDPQPTLRFSMREWPLPPAPAIRALLLLELNQVRIRALSTSSALQSTGRRRNILWVRCSAALNQHQTAAIGPTREKRQD
jgi:hypothetical protein